MEFRLYCIVYLVVEIYVDCLIDGFILFIEMNVFGMVSFLEVIKFFLVFLDLFVCYLFYVFIDEVFGLIFFGELVWFDCVF